MDTFTLTNSLHNDTGILVMQLFLNIYIQPNIQWQCCTTDPILNYVQGRERGALQTGQGSMLGPFYSCFSLNDISNFTTDGCVTNLFADDPTSYASGDSVSEVQLKLHSYLINIWKWYRENRLKNYSDKSKVMLVESKAQLKSLNVDDFILKYESTSLELIGNSKYLGMSINSDIS